MTPRIARELRRVEQALARRNLSAEQRRRLRPVVGALLARFIRAARRTAS